MKRLAIFAVFAVGLASVASALTLEPGGAFPGTTTTSAFNAIGTFNFGNQKARLTTPGQADVLGGNPGNGWWGANDGSGGVKRSWEVVWDNTTGIVTFNVFANSDYTGLAMTMSQAPIISAGNALVGLDIGANMSGTAGRSFEYSNVEFNGGSGFVAVPGANALYDGVGNTNNYFVLNGTPGSFTLRGNAQFLSGTVTSDGMRFFINGRQGEPVPEPITMSVLGLGLAALARRNRAAKRA